MSSTKSTCSAWGALRVLGVHLQICHVKYAQKFFHRPGGADAPTAPPGYAYCMFHITEVSDTVQSACSHNQYLHTSRNRHVMVRGGTAVVETFPNTSRQPSGSHGLDIYEDCW